MSDEIKKEDLTNVFDALFDAFKPKTEQEEFQRYKYLFNENTLEILEDIFSGYCAFVEGSACSVDKGRTIARTLIKSVEQGKNIKLQYTYLEYRDRGGDLGGLSNKADEELNRKCYWCPKTIEDTRKAMRIYHIIVNLRLKELGELLTAYNKEKENE